jgi:hypothetical protein
MHHRVQQLFSPLTFCLKFFPHFRETRMRHPETPVRHL